MRSRVSLRLHLLALDGNPTLAGAQTWVQVVHLFPLWSDSFASVSVHGRRLSSSAPVIVTAQQHKRTSDLHTSSHKWASQPCYVRAHYQVATFKSENSAMHMLCICHCITPPHRLTCLRLPCFQDRFVAFAAATVPCITDSVLSIDQVTVVC